MAKATKTALDRIQELEDSCKDAERRVLEMRAERDSAHELVESMEEHVQSVNAMVERWIAAFDMQMGDDGLYSFSDGTGEQYDSLFDKYRSLLKDWNKFVPLYNSTVAQKPIGRPLNASPAQIARVGVLSVTGMSLRDISDETNLGVRTIRTILGRETLTDRTSINRLQKVDPENPRAIAAKARKRSRVDLPKQIKKSLGVGQALLKEAKGLGR